MRIENYKKFNMILFIYEIYKASFWIVSFISETIDNNFANIIMFMYYPLFGFNIYSFEFLKISCYIEEVLFSISCAFSGKMIKKGLSVRFQNYIIFFTLLSVFSTGFYLMIMTVGMF